VLLPVGFSLQAGEKYRIANRTERKLRHNPADSLETDNRGRDPQFKGKGENARFRKKK